MQVKPGFRTYLAICMAKPEVNQSRKGECCPSRSVAVKTVNRRAVQRWIHGLGIAGVGADVCTTVWQTSPRSCLQTQTRRRGTAKCPVSAVVDALRGLGCYKL